MNIFPYFPCRFYEPNAWYKARITRPLIYPKMYVIDPDNHLLSLKERLAGCFLFCHSPYFYNLATEFFLEDFFK